MAKLVVSVTELAAALDEPQWRVRRIVDRLNPPVPRVGSNRAIPISRANDVARLLDKPAPTFEQMEAAHVH